MWGGSADAMVRSFDRRVESMFSIVDEISKKEAINILVYALKDNVNAYLMLEDGSYKKLGPQEGEELFNSHEEFFNVTLPEIEEVDLYRDYCAPAQLGES